ncbi:hypothetical protein AAF712_010281 [Marasmius tenuissimus]|uniref:Uncharacterized protein n=1 Tax=Marasmius tenuissimus TaxID=585030 RepID=A0ABR2ZNU0_9AGAR
MFILGYNHPGLTHPVLLSTIVNTSVDVTRGVLTATFDHVAILHIDAYDLNPSIPPSGSPLPAFTVNVFDIDVLAASTSSETSSPSAGMSAPGQAQMTGSSQRTSTVQTSTPSPLSTTAVTGSVVSTQNFGSSDSTVPGVASLLGVANGGSPTTPDTEHSALNPGLPQSSYPSDDKPSGSKHQSNIAATIGATIGALAFLIFGPFLILHYRRRNEGRYWRPGRARAFHGESMIQRREENQLERKTIRNNRDSTFEPLSSTTPAPLIVNYGDVNVSAASDASHSRGDSGSTLDHTLYTNPETESGKEATSTLELASTEITHEYIRPRTDRQMEIERKIFELQGQIIRLNDQSRSSMNRSSTPMSMDPEVLNLRERVARLTELRGEEWAMELAEKVPLEMLD